MQKVTEETTEKIIQLTAELQSIRYVLGRKKALTSAIGVMNPAEKWLLTFLCWHCLFNSRFRAINPESLCLYEPKEVNEVTFNHFLQFLRRHKGVRITTSREAPMLRLLGSCDALHRSFYLSLLTKEWISNFPIVEVQTLLDLDSINGEKVYGELEYLKTSFSDLCYPVSLRAASSKNLIPYALIREPLHSSFLLWKGEEGYKRACKNDKVELELRLSTTPRYVVTGFCDNTTYYPTDFFESKEEFERYLEGDLEVTSYITRIDNLNNFLNRTMLVYSDTSCPAIVEDEKELLDTLASFAKKGVTEILVCDANSTRTGRPYKLDCRPTFGIIDSVTPKSIKAWSNGELIECYYKFEGKEQALLSSPEVTKDKILDFYFVQVGNTEYCFGRSIRWHKPRWRDRKARESGVWIEKCALCGSTRHRHSNRGLCKACEANLHYYFSMHGADTWINPSAQMQNKRQKSVWKPNLINLVGYKYKGTIIEAREDGCWRFKGGFSEQGGESGNQEA